MEPKPLHATQTVRVGPTPTMHPVTSSTGMTAIGYSLNGHVLTVVFKNGTYEYVGVPFAVFADFLTAESKGTFFSKYIRGKYAFTRKPTKEVTHEGA